MQQRLAAELLLLPSTSSDGPNGYLADGNATYPEIPREEDLIGFVTSGEYNLSQGKGVGIGSVLIHRLVEARKWAKEAKDDGGDRVVVVRNAGESLGRLALWTVV